MKFAIKTIWQYPPYLRHVATLPWEIKLRHSVYSLHQQHSTALASRPPITRHRKNVWITVKYYEVCGLNAQPFISMWSSSRFHRRNRHWRRQLWGTGARAPRLTTV